MLALLTCSSGKQYCVKEGDFFTVDGFLGSIGDELSLDAVMLDDGKSSALSLTDKISVCCSIKCHRKGDKVFAFKKKRRKGYCRKVGYRSQLTDLTVVSIG